MKTALTSASDFRLAAVILMGGKAERLGGIDKAQLLIGNKTAFDWVCERVSPYAIRTYCSVARTEAVERFSLPVIVDDRDRQGDVGVADIILRCLRYVRDELQGAARVTHLLTCPVDTPFIPEDFVLRLMQAAGNNSNAVASAGGRLHGLHALWSFSCVDELTCHVQEHGVRRLSALHESLRSVRVEFPVGDVIDPFFNINTRSDLQQAKAFASGMEKSTVL
ncbi:MAG: molybdenum cofactor guanylyltransferase [Aquisalinus sp.]|nr:molybdenum cofactor guanylyltransferase [Aquisalinus sp.]